MLCFGHIRMFGQGYADCVRVLLEGGAETKWADLDGFSALVYAAMWGHDQVVEQLLANGNHTTIIKIRHI